MEELYGIADLWLPNKPSTPIRPPSLPILLGQVQVPVMMAIHICDKLSGDSQKKRAPIISRNLA